MRQVFGAFPPQRETLPPAAPPRKNVVAFFTIPPRVRSRSRSVRSLADCHEPHRGPATQLLARSAAPGARRRAAWRRDLARRRCLRRPDARDRGSSSGVDDDRFSDRSDDDELIDEGAGTDAGRCAHSCAPAGIRRMRANSKKAPRQRTTGPQAKASVLTSEASVRLFPLAANLLHQYHVRGKRARFPER